MLVIEDDPTSVDLLDGIPRGQRATTSTVARDGAQRLDAVRRRLSRRPSFSTSGFPASTAGTCCGAIKADPATADMPVVVASVLDDRARGLSLGAADYLVKPVSRDDVLGALADALGRHVDRRPAAVSGR